MSRIGIFCFFIVASTGASLAAATDKLVDDVPIPADVRIEVALDAPEGLSRFSGAWVGSWRGLLHHILIVENISASGEARVVYAIGSDATAGVKAQWRRLQATVSTDMLTITAPSAFSTAPGDTFSTTYVLTPADSLRATYRRGDVIARATLSRIAVDELMLPGANIAWTEPSEFLNTTIQEGGRPIRLEVVIKKPSGSGPFPLLVFNHGSTGRGTDPNLFTQTYASPEIVDFFVEKGWMVAFPQRRGRGKSDGLYDEGFERDRALGYSCDPDRSLPGADRALDDIEAAVEALQQRPGVAAGPILIGGVSRGGVLAIAYAGMHPQQVLGALNFVGGWMGEGCRNAGDINGALFQRGGKFGRPTLWLYGQHDSFYSIEHSRSNFEVFKKAGGNGEFFEYAVPGGFGHGLLWYPSLWSGDVEKYLTAIGAPRAQ
jgi:pimeloyl-ACP methyl ester carboxylesterase